MTFTGGVNFGAKWLGFKFFLFVIGIIIAIVIFYVWPYFDSNAIFKLTCSNDDLGKEIGMSAIWYFLGFIGSWWLFKFM
jgi:hypothetical protein